MKRYCILDRETNTFGNEVYVTKEAALKVAVKDAKRWRVIELPESVEKKGKKK